MLTGKPLTFVGRFFQDSPTANFLAKSFLAGYGAQAFFVLGPLIPDPGSIIVSFTHRAFAYAFFNGTLGYGLAVALGIKLSDPYDKPKEAAFELPFRNSTPAVTSTRSTDLNEK